jgi:N-acetylglucosaminyl-diphospho-decaprenol L-rhamnosyltransferase
MVDVVTVSYNSAATLRDCVVPLSDLDDVAVTVVDNRSTDGSLATVEGLPGVRGVLSDRNGGFGYGCNRGAEGGSNPYILFLNPDARIGAAGVRRLVAELQAHPGAAIVGPKLLEADGEQVPSMRRFQRAGSSWAQALFLHRLIRAPWANEIVGDPAAYAVPASPEWLSGACMLVRREVFEALGGFDEGFFLYCDDMDLCTRARAAGHDVRFTPDVEVHHAGGQSAPRTSLYPVLAASRRRYAAKHASRASALSQHAALAVHAATHVVTSARRPPAARGHYAALRAMLSRSRSAVPPAPGPAAT